MIHTIAVPDPAAILTEVDRDSELTRKHSSTSSFVSSRIMIDQHAILDPGMKVTVVEVAS